MSNAALQHNDWIGMFDENNPKAVINRVPKTLRCAMLEIPENVRVMDEEELTRLAEPPVSICEARIKFWKHMEDSEGPVRITDVFRHSGSYYHQLIHNPYRLMFFLTPPVNYLWTQEAILERSLKSLHKFIAGDHMYIEKTVRKTNKDGDVEETTTREINIKAVEAARKIYETMSDRIHGAVAMNLRIQGQHAHAILTPEQKIAGMNVHDIMSLGSGMDGREDMPPVLAEGELPPEDRSYTAKKGDLIKVDIKDVIEADLADLMDDPTDD